MSQSHEDQIFDLAVIGAGPVGAAAAAQVARVGLSVALNDKARFPRDKLCGGLYSGRAMTYHREIFQDEIDEAIHSSTDAVAFWHRKTLIGRLDGVPRFYMTMRQDLDVHIMRRAVAAGVTDLTGQRIAVLDLDGQSVTFAVGERVGWHCLIGADWVNSQVGKAFVVKTLVWRLKLKKYEHLSFETVLRIDFVAAKGGYGLGV